MKSNYIIPVVFAALGFTGAVWMAGQTTLTGASGKDISGQFEAQARRAFALMDATLKRIGGSLANLVTMTVFIKDLRNGDRFIEIQGIAVLDDECSNSKPCSR